MLKQTFALGAIAIALTGCVVSPFDDYDNNDRRYDRNQYDSRYDRDRDRDRDHRDRKWDGKYDNDRDHKRPNPYWDQNRQR